MLALSALSDWNARMNNYFMLDAAVAIEAIDTDPAPVSSMIHSGWRPYTNRLYSANWHNLFGTMDYRSKLNWNRRLTNFGSTEVYNFYSSGEEVLREWSPDPPTGLLSYSAQVAANVIVNQSPVSSFVWVWQEKAKGGAARNDVLGSDHGGWKFNTNYSALTPAQAALLSTNQLRTNAFFDFGSADFSDDLALQGDLGAVYAYYSRHRILSDAIPAVTWVVGSHEVTNLNVRFGGPRNFDMQALYQNGWPSIRGTPQWPPGTTAAGEWWHSDFKDVAYLYTYKLFHKFVETGNLK
jgi:hypothetical protein